MSFLLVLESIFQRWIHVMTIDYWLKIWFFTEIFSQTVFVLFFNRLHLAISLVENTVEWYFPHLSWVFFPFQNGKKYRTGKINCFLLSRFTCAKLKIFLSAEKFLKWTPAYMVIIQRRKNFKGSLIKELYISKAIAKSPFFDFEISERMIKPYRISLMSTPGAF